MPQDYLLFFPWWHPRYSPSLNLFSSVFISFLIFKLEIKIKTINLSFGLGNMNTEECVGSKHWNIGVAREAKLEIEQSMEPD